MTASFRSLGNWFSRGQRPARRARQRRRMLACERLEARQVLASNLASITGMIFIDATGDGLTAGEQVAGANVNLYADLNNNGTLEAGGADGAPLQMATSNGSGVYRFNGVSAGAYFVQQPAQPGLNLKLQVSPRILITADDAMGVPGVNIDSFNETSQQISATGGGSDFDAVTPAPDAIGNERDMFAQVTSVAGQLDLQANVAVPGVLTAGGLGAAIGPRVVTWDGVDNDGETLNPTGLGGADLTRGGVASAVQLAIGASEAGGAAKMRIYTNANLYSEASFNIPQTTTGGPTGEVVLDFETRFQSKGISGGANFSNVGAIEFELGSNIIDVDMQLDFVSTVGPTVFREIDFDNFEPIDLELVKTVSNATPDLDEVVTYTLIVSNVENEIDSVPATNVQVRDVLPPGVVYVTDNPTQGDYDQTTGIWTVGTINVGADATLTISARVTTPGVKTNVAEVSQADQFDIDSTPGNNNPEEDDQDDAQLEPAIVDLQLTKTVNKALPNLGDNVVFTIRVENVDNNTEATNVQVRDVLPTGMSLVDNSPSQGTYDTASGVWTVGALTPNGGAATLELTAKVDARGARTNTAEVIAVDQADIDSTPGNNNSQEDDQDSADLQTAEIDLQLTKTVNNATPNLGADVIFTVTVSNQGPNGATNVAVSDPLPAGLTFKTATPTQGTYNPTSGVWTIGSLGATGSASMTILATVTTAGVTTNIAQISQADQFDVDSTPGNNAAAEDDQDDAQVEAKLVDLSITKTDTPDPVLAGGQLTYLVTVTNNGPVAATGVEVEENLPDNVTLLSATPSQGTYDEVTNVWSVGNLADQASATMTLIVSVGAEATGPLTNVAVVSANEPEEVLTNNTATVVTQVTPRSSSLQGFVYVDLNNNGLKDPTEPGIFGVTITLTGATTGVQTTVTDAAGSYLFDNLAPDTYTIQQTQPSSFRDGADTAETELEGDPDGVQTVNDAFQDVDLLAGVAGVNFNFGELAAMLSKRRFLASSVV